MQNIFINNWRTYLFLLCAFFITQNSQAQLLSEGFDGATFPPAGWAMFDNGIGLTNSWMQATTGVYSGAGSAYIQYETIGSISEDWLVTPAFTPTATEYQLTFYQKQTYSSNYGTTYEIRVSTTSQTNAATFTTVASYGENTFGTAYSQKIIDLSAYIGQSVYVAFVEVQDDGDDWYVDEVVTLQSCSGTPAASTTISSTTNACAGTPFTLSLSTTYSSVDYQWQSSPNGVIWTDIIGATNATYTASQTDTTYYQCVISCATSGFSAYSTIIEVDMNSWNNCYCTPAYNISSCGSSDFIDGVQLNAISNTGTGCAISGSNYSDYTTLSTVLAQGATYPITVTPTSAYSQSATVWIDFDHSGTFDAGEMVFFNPASPLPMSGIITVPATAMLGTTRMRVRGVYGVTVAQDPCSSAFYGETEDYSIEIATSCMPTASTTNSTDTTVCSSDVFVLGLSQSYGAGYSYQWQTSADGTTWTDAAGEIDSIMYAAQYTATYYQCIITCTLTGETTTSAPLEVSMNALSACYCSPAYFYASCISGDFIDGVELNTLSNTGTDCAVSGPNYSDYTSMGTSLIQGVPYPITITPTASWAQSATVWVDMNQDNILDTTEIIFFVAASTTPMTGMITIPGTAMTGTTLMRVRGVYGATTAQSPCDSVFYGETEDYYVEILSGSNCFGTPTASNTIASDTAVCSTSVLDLSLDQAYNFLGITYQWQSSPDGINWTDITGATNPTYSTTQSAMTYYQCIITCTNSTASVISTPVSVNMNPATACYCIPTHVGCGNGNITNVAVNTINNASTCGPTDYTQYAISTQVSQGVTYPLSVTTDQSCIISVWFDWNQDGTFDVSEWTQVTTSSTVNVPSTVNITIPATANLGMTAMRIRSRLSGNPNGAGDACTGFGSGESEDYMVDVIAGTACSGAPAAANTLASDSIVCPQDVLNFSLDQNYSLTGISYQWQSSPDGTTWADITGATNATYSTSQNVATYYQCVITCANSSQSATATMVMIDMNAPLDCYCIPVYGNASCASNDYIDSLTFNTISNNATGCAISGPNYSDYTSISTQVVQGASYPISIKGDGIYNQSATVWIDFDHSGSFDATEIVFFNAATTATMTGTVTIPPTVLTGSTRMRVRGVYAATIPQDPCASVNYGETEDYTVDILSPADVEVVTVDVPADACTFSTMEMVMVNLINTGMAAIQPGAASVDLAISGANTSLTTLANTTTIPQGGSEMLMFMVDLSAVGANNFSATATLTNDPNTANNLGTAFNMSTGNSSTSQNIAICQGGSVQVGSNTYTTSGTYTDVLTSVLGCDSVITTVLVVNPLPIVNPTTTVSTCSCVTLSVPSTNLSYLWSTGATTSTISVCTGGTITVTVTDANGCQNTQTTNVVVNQAPAATFTSTQVNNAALVNFTSNTTSGTTPIVYAWNFGDPSSGANNTSSLQNPAHTYAANGTYNVSLTISNVCDTVVITNQVTVSGVSIDDNLLVGELSIYPNPNNGNFTINSENLQATNLTIEMFTLQGQSVYTHKLSKVNGFTHKVETTSLAKGVYMVKVSDGTRNAYKKVVIE